jgi:hypothetical protein
MKGIVRDRRELLIATANITDVGLGVSPNPNIECATVVPMEAKDRCWITQIQRESITVTCSQFDKFCAHIENQRYQKEAIINEFSFTEPAECDFSVLDLPTIETPQRLLDRLHSAGSHHDFNDRERILQDAKTFGLPLVVTSPANALQLLRDNFFAKPIIHALMEFVVSKRYFGEIKRWIRERCRDADVLTNAELIQRVRSVLNWIVALSDGRFIVGRPHFSECLTPARDLTGLREGSIQRPTASEGKRIVGGYLKPC